MDNKQSIHIAYEKLYKHLYAQWVKLQAEKRQFIVDSGKNGYKDFDLEIAYFENKEHDLNISLTLCEILFRNLRVQFPEFKHIILSS